MWPRFMLEKDTDRLLAFYAESDADAKIVLERESSIELCHFHC